MALQPVTLRRWVSEGHGWAVLRALEEHPWPDLIVLGFDNEDTAEAVRTLSAKLMQEHLIELSDAVVVVRTQDGKVKIHQAFSPTAAGAASGALGARSLGCCS